MESQMMHTAAQALAHVQIRGYPAIASVWNRLDSKIGKEWRLLPPDCFGRIASGGRRSKGLLTAASGASMQRSNIWFG
jgi:hypothetical protein